MADEPVAVTWLTTEEVGSRYGLELGPDHADSRNPQHVKNKLDGAGRRVWLEEAVQGLVERLTPVRDETQEQRLRREILERLDASERARREERSVRRA